MQERARRQEAEARYKGTYYPIIRHYYTQVGALVENACYVTPDLCIIAN